MEIENDSKINFLDMTLIRQNNRIITNWYQKDTSSGRILNFLSAHPYKMKYNVGLSFAKRVQNLSHSSFHSQNTTRIKKILELNNYPHKIITKIINQIPQSNRNQTNNVIIQNLNNDKIYTAMHYIPTLSENLSKSINNSNNISLAYKPVKTLGKSLFTKTKQKIAEEDKSGVVYKIPCGGCNKVYIGETSKKLKMRQRQHKNDYKNLLSLSASKTSLITHTQDTHHIFNYEDMQVLDYESNRKRREILEATYIMAHSPNTVNRKVDTNSISEQFLPVINTYTSNSKLSPIRSINSRHLHLHRTDEG